MSEFKKGQLVACRDLACEEWMLGIFDGERGEELYVRLPLSLTCSSKRPERFLQVKPAEEVWPEIFIGLDRGAADQAVQALDQTMYALEMESALVQRLRRQIEWLCRQIQSIADIEELGNVCPSVGRSSCYNDCQCNCIACWEQASLKAVEEGGDDQA